MAHTDWKRRTCASPHTSSSLARAIGLVDNNAFKAFCQEVLMLAQINHPNLIKVS